MRWDAPIFTSPACVYRHVPPHLAYDVGAWDLNSDPYAHVALYWLSQGVGF